MNVLREEFAKRLNKHQERIYELEKAMEHMEQTLSAAEARVDSARHSLLQMMQFLTVIGKITSNFRW